MGSLFVASCLSEINIMQTHFWSILAIFFKLFKSVKVIKVALAGAAFGAYSIIFSWQFALVLLSIIIFHEYGHVWAMKRFGIATKGIYLIPFVGGVAVGDKTSSEWQTVYISLMGPIFGLLMTLIAYVIFLVTNNHFAGQIASFSALINLFNLLPVLPLDGGQTVKAMVFSGKKYWGVLLLLISSAFFFALSIQFGLFFISFFIVLGVLDLLVSWKQLASENKIAMEKYGIVVSLAWYLLTISAFIAVIYAMAMSDLPGGNIAISILKS
ncbi:MAG: site-2 protease family protein [Methylococcales bacterium]|nr:site-2 protease family protein [Methylococcales bacterium]MBT7408180.1 site-2 protease family protein [Methylococcales bacterium]